MLRVQIFTSPDLDQLQANLNSFITNAMKRIVTIGPLGYTKEGAVSVVIVYDEYSLFSPADNPSRKCPRCGSQMLLRTRKSDGSKFWGCVKFPDCKGTLANKELTEDDVWMIPEDD